MIKNQKSARGTNAARPKITIERTYVASVDEVWELWTTKEGFESWWGPVGFSTTVKKLELRPGGTFEYAMTATGADQVQAMKSAGLSLTSVAHGRYTEVTAPRRLAYTTVVDFIPGVAPYEVAALVEVDARTDGSRVVVTEDAMHDEEWTHRSTAGMESCLDRLAQVVNRRRASKS